MQARRHRGCTEVLEIYSTRAFTNVAGFLIFSNLRRLLLLLVVGVEVLLLSWSWFIVALVVVVLLMLSPLPPPLLVTVAPPNRYNSTPYRLMIVTPRAVTHLSPSHLKKQHKKYFRGREPPDSGTMSDLMWSDPQPFAGRSPSKRGVGMAFGPDVTKAFLEGNDLKLLVRSHEVKEVSDER